MNLKSNKLRTIVLVFNKLDIGGIERKIVDISNYYSENNSTKVFLLLKHNTGILLPTLSPRVQVMSPLLNTSPKLSSLIFPFWLILKFFKTKPNIIISFGNFSSICAVLANKLSINTHLIVSEDSSITTQLKTDSFSQIRKKLLQFLYPLATHIIVLTRASKSKLSLLSPGSLKKILLLPNWLPLSVPTHLTITPKNIDILFLGRFESQKNPLLFLRICRSVIHQRPNTKVAIYGSGSLKTAIRKYIAKHHLSQNINLYPPTTDVGPIFQNSRILLLTSTHEGFPLVILEALAHNCLTLCKQLDEYSEFFDKYKQNTLYKDQTHARNVILSLLESPSQSAKITNYYRCKVHNSQTPNFKRTIDLIDKYL